jgi:hypothetical protein
MTVVRIPDDMRDGVATHLCTLDEINGEDLILNVLILTELVKSLETFGRQAKEFIGEVEGAMGSVIVELEKRDLFEKLNVVAEEEPKPSVVRAWKREFKRARKKLSFEEYVAWVIKEGLVGCSPSPEVMK